MKKFFKILLNKRSKTLSFEAEFALSFENFEFFRAWVLMILSKKKPDVLTPFPYDEEMSS